MCLYSKFSLKNEWDLGEALSLNIITMKRPMKSSWMMLCTMCSYVYTWHVSVLCSYDFEMMEASSTCITTWVRATSHIRLKALDHGNVRALIGWKGGDRPSSLHTRRWRPKGPKKVSWMISLHGVLHGGLWIRVHDLPEFASGPPPRGGYGKNSGRPFIF